MVLSFIFGEFGTELDFGLVKLWQLFFLRVSNWPRHYC